MEKLEKMEEDKLWDGGGGRGESVRESIYQLMNFFPINHDEKLSGNLSVTVKKRLVLEREGGRVVVGRETGF